MYLRSFLFPCRKKENNGKQAYEKIAHAYEIAKEPAAFVPVVREYIFPE